MDQPLAKRRRLERSFGGKCGSIAIGSDHGGFALKQQIIAYIKDKYKQVAIRDFGTSSEENKVDYPDIASAVCESILDGGFDRGILLDGAGVASGIAANKFHGIRCGVVHDHFSVSMGRKHNDVNVISLGGKSLGIEAAKEIIDVFVTCEFEGDRHVPRLQKIERIEDRYAGSGSSVISGSIRRSSGGSAATQSPYKLPM